MVWFMWFPPATAADGSRGALCTAAASFQAVCGGGGQRSQTKLDTCQTKPRYIPTKPNQARYPPNLTLLDKHQTKPSYRYTSNQTKVDTHQTKLSQIYTKSNPARCTPNQTELDIHQIKPSQIYTKSNLARCPPTKTELDSHQTKLNQIRTKPN